MQKSKRPFAFSLSFSLINIINLPKFSRNLRAFSRKDGPPSISSSASKIGLPTTNDLTGRFSLPGNQKVINPSNRITRWGTKSLTMNQYIHWWKDPSIVSFVSVLKIPLCPITRAALGACARACSRAVFHSYKSSDVSAWNWDQGTYCQEN